jgi:hypothetical protein
MQTLIWKDLRLAGDALRPALLILVGFVVGLALLSAVPESILPLAGSLSITDLLYGLPRFLLVASGPFALVATAMTLRGDRRHGATLLAGSLPVSAARQGASAVVALLVVTAILPLLTAILLAIRLYVVGDDMAWREILTTPTFAATASAAGTSYALAASRRERSCEWTIALAVVLVVAAGLVGLVVGWSLAALDPGIQAMRSDLNRVVPEYRQFMQIGAVSGVSGGAIGGAIVGLPRLLGASGRRLSCVLWAAAVMSVLVSSSLGTRTLIVSSPGIRASVAYHEAWLARLSPEELAERVRALPSSSFRSGPLFVGGNAESDAVQSMALAHVRQVPPLELSTDPVAEALRLRESFTSASDSVDTLMWLVPHHDPRRLGLALEALRRYPADFGIAIQTVVSPEIETRWPWPRHGTSRAEDVVRRILRTALETLIREGHPESERMKAVLDVLPPPAESPSAKNPAN